MAAQHRTRARKLRCRSGLEQGRSACARGLATLNGRPAPARSGLDDIMNLGGGGVYSPALMAPALAPPPVDFASAADTSVAAAPSPRARRCCFNHRCACSLVAPPFAFTSMGGKDSDKTGAAASATASAAAADRRDHRPQLREPTAAGAAAERRPPRALPPCSPLVRRHPNREAEKKTAARPKGRQAGAAPPVQPLRLPRPKNRRPRPHPRHLPRRPGPISIAAAASSALSAAASAAQSCKKARRTYRVWPIAVTFANSGAATTAAVEGPPFAGTPVGGCVAARFRGVHVPPFGGARYGSQTFIIN